MSAHLLDDPALAAIASDLGVEWRPVTSGGAAWESMNETQREGVRRSTRHKVEDRFLACINWERIK